MALRHIPSFAAFDDARYDKIESALMAQQPQLPVRHAFDLFLVPSIIRQSMARRHVYRVIDPAHLSEDDKTFLEQEKISIDFVARNRAGSGSASSYDNRAADGLVPSSQDFQLDAITQGGIAAVCPCSGEVLRSNRSILAAEGNPIYYRFESSEVFYLSVGRPGIGYGKLYLYFPRIQTVILLRDKCFWHGRGELDRLRAHMIVSWRDLIAYFQQEQKPLVCALIDSSQFAHHLWNDLTGVDKVLSMGHAAHVDKLVVCAEPFGPIDLVFPALSRMDIERHPLREVSQRALTKNWLLIRPGDNRISERVIKGVCDAAHAVTAPAIRDEVQHLRDNCWPILWVTIRTGNRAWVSQCSSIPDIVNDLSKAFPNIALIIDGFCTPYDMPAIDRKEQERVIQEESRCVDSIRDRLNKSIPVHVNVGKPIPESVLFATITDCYLANHGSLQHKIGWIANCPGVVHSNADDLRGTSGKHRAVSARPNSIVPKYLDPSTIADVAGAIPKGDNRWSEHFSNYDFDYRLARDALLSLLTEQHSKPENGTSRRIPPLRGLPSREEKGAASCAFFSFQPVNPSSTPRPSDTP